MSGTRAIDVDCPRCKMPAGTFCGLGAGICQARINLAGRTTREANAARKREASQ